jgi:hypothetical protein
VTCVFATSVLVPPRSPVHLLANVAAVPGGLALRTNLEVLHMPCNRTPLVVTILGRF